MYEQPSITQGQIWGLVSGGTGATSTVKTSPSPETARGTVFLLSAGVTLLQPSASGSLIPGGVRTTGEPMGSSLLGDQNWCGAKASPTAQHHSGPNLRGQIQLCTCYLSGMTTEFPYCQGSFEKSAFQWQSLRYAVWGAARSL